MADQLAQSLGRAVIIDDTSLRPMAISAQLGEVDSSRIESVLQRRTSERLRRLLRAHRVFQATEPVAIPAYEDLGTLPRMCFPLWTEGQLRGFLWLINKPPLDTAQLTRTARAAEHAAQLLEEHAMWTVEQLHAARHLVDDLLGADPERHLDAARHLLRDGVLTKQPPYTLVVMRQPQSAREPADFERTYYELRQRLAPAVFEAASTRDDEFVAVLSVGATCPDGPARVIQDAIKELPGEPFAVGSGGRVDELAMARSLLGQARYAAEVAAHAPEFERAADWDRLGVYTALQHLCGDETALDRICPGVRSLLDEANSMYATTVHTYLDSGADAKATATSLYIHRSTLYWRLSRVEELLGLDLGNGSDRLNLHMALKLAQLQLPAHPRE